MIVDKSLSSESLCCRLASLPFEIAYYLLVNVYQGSSYIDLEGAGAEACNMDYIALLVPLIRPHNMLQLLL